jgi:hypothetical protein
VAAIGIGEALEKMTELLKSERVMVGRTGDWSSAETLQEVQKAMTSDPHQRVAWRQAVVDATSVVDSRLCCSRHRHSDFDLNDLVLHPLHLAELV